MRSLDKGEREGDSQSRWRESGGIESGGKEKLKVIQGFDGLRRCRNNVQITSILPYCEEIALLQGDTTEIQIKIHNYNNISNNIQ